MTEQIYDSGDLQLHVGTALENQAATTFLVSSVVMRLISPVFKVMLDPNGSYKESGSTDVDLPDDPPDSMRIILHVAHHQLHALQAPYPASQLVDLSVLCDKYQMVSWMKPHVQEWLSGFESSENVNWSSCAFVHFTFENWSELRKASRKFMFKMAIDKTGKPLDQDQAPIIPNFPSKLLELIVSTRKAVMEEMLEHYWKRIHALTRKENSCQGSGTHHSTYMCNAIALGALRQNWELHKLPKLCEHRAKFNITKSINSIYALLSKMRMETDTWTRSYRFCDVFEKLKPLAESTMNNAPDPVDLYLNERSLVNQEGNGTKVEKTS